VGKLEVLNKKNYQCALIGKEKHKNKGKETSFLHEAFSDKK
jgi:hypothetical protein